jgi:uncharacterized protein YbbK (DUF523 family)
LLEGRVFDRQGIEHTQAFAAGCAEALRLAKQSGCRLAVLKARSPSCGVGEIYDGTFSRCLVKGNGLFAQALLDAGFIVLSDEDPSLNRSRGQKGAFDDTT